MTTRPFRPFFIACVWLCTACGGGDGKATAPRRIGITPARREAIDVFQSLCVTCHGTTGSGDGPGAAACNPRPRAFADPAWQASVTDEHIVKTVLFGGAAVGKSAQMPAQPQLKGKDELLANLVSLVRAFSPSK